MAEYKTYACDYKGCGKQGAIHFEIPEVDRYFDKHDIQIKSGFVDLCPEHVPLIIESALFAFSHNLETRRKFWKRLHGK